MIVVSQDSEGLRLAALELMERSLYEDDVERQLACIQSDDLGQAQKLLARLSLDMSPGFYDRVLYLVWLKDRMDAGIEFENITAAEADGIAALVRARSEFQSAHPPCPNCAKRLSSRGQKRCFGCGREL